MTLSRFEGRRVKSRSQ